MLIMVEPISPQDLRRIKAQFGIVGHSPKLDYALTTASQVAKTDMSVLIMGDSGTGKESFSKLIHALSPRKHYPFVPVNCGAIPEGTVDSELFGHEKGAFTGATDARKGYFEYADKGTIFLDEVAELPLSTQARLLRILEYGEFMKVGSSRVQRVDVRIVAASNVDLQRGVSEGKFREDLYYRLSTVPIAVPALRDRKEDIPILFRRFAADHADRYKTAQIHLSPAAEKALMNYHFPGNVRQLKNVVEQLAVFSLAREVDEEMLLKCLPRAPQTTSVVLEKERFSKLSDREILYQILLEMRKDVNQLKSLTHKLLEKEKGEALLPEHGRLFSDAEKGAAGALRSLSEAAREQDSEAYQEISVEPPVDYEVREEVVAEADGDDYSVKGLEREAITRALAKYKRKKIAAKRLGISERTLYRKLQAYAASKKT